MIESLCTSWGKFLKNEFEKDYFKKLSEFVEIERKKQIDAFDKEDIDKIIIVKKIMNIGKKLD